MKQYLVRTAKVLWTMIICLMALFVLIDLAIHLTGIWEINVCGLKLNFESLTGVGIVIVSSVSLMRDRVDVYLSTRDAKLEYEERKKRRRSLRIVIWATWFVIYFPIYAYGQIYYAHLGSKRVNLLDLIIVLAYGIVGAAIAIPITKTEEPESHEGDSIDNAIP